MTKSDPPRLATALLRRFLHDNEPLVGDLFERFAVSQSRLWFWREVLTAVVIRAFQRPDRDHPLGLANHLDIMPHGPARSIEQPRQINLTASPLPGVGGLSLATLGALITVVRPDVWWMFLPAIIGGAALAVTMVLVRRRH